MKKTILSTMIAALGVTALSAQAQDAPVPTNDVQATPEASVSTNSFPVLQDSSFSEKYYQKTDYENHYSNSNAYSDVYISKYLDVFKYVYYDGYVDIDGEINVDGAAFATINNKQSNRINFVDNYKSENTVDLSTGSALSGANGVVNVNVSAGDNNQQDNATALTALTVDNGLIYSADAEVFSYQDNEHNYTNNYKTPNTVTLGEATLEGAMGNVGVNLAAGNNIQQKNNLAVATVFNGSLSESNVSAEQYSDHNITWNYYQENVATIGGTVLANASGNIGLNVGVGTGIQQANHVAIASN